MSSRCRTFSASSAGASTRKGTWWGYSARPEFGRASPNGSSLGASSCRQISSRRWRRCPGKRVGDGSPIARSLGARDRDLCRGHAGHLGARAAVAVVDRTGAAERCGGAAAFVRGTEQRRPGGLAHPDSRCQDRRGTVAPVSRCQSAPVARSRQFTRAGRHAVERAELSPHHARRRGRAGIRGIHGSTAVGGGARRGERRRLLAVSVSAPQKDALQDRKSTRLNSSHGYISYAVFCLKKKKQTTDI